MGKPGDPHDVTQPLSESQVVAVTSSPPPIAPNDQSVAWKGTVVPAAEFAPGKPSSSRAKWIVIAVLGIGAIGVAAYELVPRSSNVEPAKVAPPIVDATAVAPVAPAAIPGDASEPPDAMPPADAAVPPPAVVPAKTTKKKRPRWRGH